MINRTLKIVSIIAPAVFAQGCASTGATFRSGVGDAFLEEPPWYAGKVVEPGPIAHLPIVFQRGATGSEMWDLSAARGTPLSALLGEMNRFLDSLNITKPAVSGDSLRVIGTPPNVHFGCERLTMTDCDNAEDQRMRLAVGRPSTSWTNWVRGLIEPIGVQRVLVLSLETGNYFPRQKNFRGDKVIDLGTDYELKVPWLTALDKPVSVLQITGALMDNTGTAIRIGAEGLLAKRTNFVLGAFGVQAIVSDEDVEHLRTARRDDLPGQPLVWQVALRNIVTQLSGQRAQSKP
jgi:hypothetical protein